MTEESPLKPRLRGVIHQWAAVAALVGGVTLVALSRTARGALAAAVFATSLVALFAISATYHRVTWAPAARTLMRRLDHAAIYLLIAGTYTPFALLALPSPSGERLLAAAWIAAALGILQTVLWIRAPKPLVAALAVAAGWTIVPWFGDLARALPAAALGAIVAGGLCYTLGAVAYATKLRTPWPSSFGYHEVFHALTVVAAALHFAAVLQLVRAT